MKTKTKKEKRISADYWVHLMLALLIASTLIAVLGYYLVFIEPSPFSSPRDLEVEGKVIREQTPSSDSLRLPADTSSTLGEFKKFKETLQGILELDSTSTSK